MVRMGWRSFGLPHLAGFPLVFGTFTPHFNTVKSPFLQACFGVSGQ